MSFEQFQFKYNPPATVPASAPTSSSSAATASLIVSNGSGSAQKSAASALLSRLSDLLDTNQFLQAAILARSTGLGIEFDPSVDPVTAQALKTIYPNLPVPTSLTVSMYNNLLDGEMTAMQLESALGTNSSNEVNPFQTAAIAQVNGAIEDGLINSGQFQTTLPLLLRQLKGDAVIMNNLTAQISQYPVVSAPAQPSVSTNSPNQVSMRGQDISPAVSLTLNSSLDAQSKIYASMYQLTASVGAVANDVNNVLTTYFMEPAVNIIRMISLFQSLQGMVNACRLKSIVKGLSGLSFVRLTGEASAMVFMLDRVVQSAVQPLEVATSQIGTMLRKIAFADATASTIANGIKGTFTNQTGSLKGCSMAYNCGMPHNAGAKKPAIPALQNSSQGLLNMASHLDWAMGEMNKKMATMQEAFQKLLARRQNDQANQLDLMCSLQAINTMTQLAQAVMSYNSSSPAVGASKTVSQTAAVGQILNGMSSPTGTSFVVSNGQMQAVPPSVPTPPANVQNVLTSGGMNMIVASSTTVKAPSIGAVS